MPLLLVIAIAFSTEEVHVTYAIAESESEQGANKVAVSVSGEDIVAGNTYYLEWTGLQVDYNGNSQSPSAVLKCNEDENFEKQMTISLSKDSNAIESAIDTGDYVAVATCDGITFAVENSNSKTFLIAPKSVAVTWKGVDDSSDNFEFTYNGQERGPTASYTDVNGNDIPLSVNGPETDACATGTQYTASVDSNAAGGNYTLTNLECKYTINPKSVAVTWKGVDDSKDNFEFTYNGQEQGPTASYTDVNDNEVTLAKELINGLETDACATGTQYTASVTSDAAGINYILTNLEREYTINPKSVAVTWKGIDNSNSFEFTYNGHEQGPTASYKDIGGDDKPINVSGLKINACAAGTPYIANVDSNAAGGNYTLTNLEREYTISPLSTKVIWTDDVSFVYNGQSQGPVASFVDLDGNIITLAVSGLETNAGMHTARVASNSEDGNFSLTGNLTLEYTIEKLSCTVYWTESEFTENGQIQAPKAFIAGPDGKLVKLPVRALGIKAGDYSAEIDLSRVDANYDLSGDLSITYTILPEDLFGDAGIALSIVFGVLFAGALVGILLLFFKHKRDFEYSKAASSRVSEQSDREIRERDDEIDILKSQNKKLQADKAEILNEIDKQQKENAAIRKKNNELNRRLKEETKPREEETRLQIELDQLRKQTEDLNSQNEQLTQKIHRLQKKLEEAGIDRGYPIEAYLPEIKEAIQDALNIDYNVQNPNSSYLGLQLKIKKILRVLTNYESQRR